MENFQFYNPVQLVFGRGQLEKLPNLIPDGVERVLVVYGGGSIKRNGIYTNVMKKLENYEVFELGGVEPNPRITTVNRGADLCKQHNIDFILAVGGGSVIDCTKSIAVGAKYDGDAWDLVTRKVKAPGGLPFGTVLTAAATGSEMNRGSVITNWETNEKYGWGSQYTWPLFSILDPVHTYSVPREQTVYGIVDMMSHILEDYFHKPTNAPVQDRMAEGILRTIIETAPKLLKNLNHTNIAKPLCMQEPLRLMASFRWVIEAIGRRIILNMRCQPFMTSHTQEVWQFSSRIGWSIT